MRRRTVWQIALTAGVMAIAGVVLVAGQEPQKIPPGPRVVNEVEGQTTVLTAVPAGTRVKKGELVMELDSAALRERLTEEEIGARQAESDHEAAKTALEVAQMALKAFFEETLPALQMEAEYNRAVAEAELNLAKKQLEQLTKSPDSDEFARERAQIDVLKAEYRHRAAERDKQRVQGIARRKQTAELEGAVRRAQTELLASEVHLQLETKRLEHLRSQVDKCKVLMHMDGVVRSTIEEGDTVRERQVLFWIEP